MRTPQELVEDCRRQMAILSDFYSKPNAIETATRTQMEQILRHTQILCSAQQRLVSMLVSGRTRPEEALDTWRLNHPQGGVER